MEQVTRCGAYQLHPSYDSVDIAKADAAAVLVGPGEGSVALQKVLCSVRSRLWEKCTKVLARVVLQLGYTKTSNSCGTRVKQPHSRGLQCYNFTGTTKWIKHGCSC